MSSEIKKEIELEIAHVLFLDIIAYSKLLINEQRAWLISSIKWCAVRKRSAVRRRQVDS